MLRLIDRTWLRLEDKLKGFKYGYNAIYTYSVAEESKISWDEGFDNGIVSCRKAVINKLENMNPKLSNAEFQLGYDHAVAIVKGDI